MESLEEDEAAPDAASALDLLTDEDQENEEREEEAPLETPTAVCRLPSPVADRWPPLEPAPRLSLAPRSYQEEALVAWIEAGGRGVVVLPTGAGKTALALMAIARAGLRPLIVVPTLELLKQWTDGLRRSLHLPASAVGQVGGGARQVRAATVITYDSAWRRSSDLRPFGLLVFDEVHHLPSASYRRIAVASEAPFRLGLTATPERADLLHQDLERLVGPVVYRRSPGELARTRHIARFRQERLFIDLTPEEEHQYYQLVSRFQWYMARNRLRG